RRRCGALPVRRGDQWAPSSAPAGDTELAACRCATKRFDDCMVADLSMPDLNGLDLQRRLAESDLERPFVFITGPGDIRSSVQAMQAGAVDFRAKPLDQAELLQALGRAERETNERLVQKIEFRKKRMPSLCCENRYPTPTASNLNHSSLKRPSRLAARPTCHSVAVWSKCSSPNAISDGGR